MITHKRIRVVNRKVEEVPIKQGVYSTHTRKNGWTDIRIIELPPSCVIDSEYVYDKGKDVEQIYESHFSNREGDFLLFNASFVSGHGQILGKTIVDEQVYAPDIDGKTENRRHLYWQGGEFRIGRIEDPVGKKWGAQGTPSVKAMGDNALDLAMRIEKTPGDIAAVNPHTVAGLKDNGSLFMLFVDGRGSVDVGLSVKDCMYVLMEHGCTSFINLDGGHSSTLVTSSTAIQARLGMVTPVHICDTRYTQPRAVHHALALHIDIEKLLREGIAMTSQEFIDKVAPIAVKLRKEGSPIFPSVRIAQTLLETGGVIHSWNNLVGLKVGSGWTSDWWHGAYVSKGTWEVVDGQRLDDVQANFRAYESIEYGFRDQDVLFSFDRYADVRKASTPEDQTVALYRCGYATDLDYYRKLLRIIDQYNLKQFDKKAEVVPIEQNLPLIQDQVPVDVYGQEMKGYLIGDRTYVEVRKYSELHGDVVLWNSDERKVYIKRGN